MFIPYEPYERWKQRTAWRSEVQIVNDLHMQCIEISHKRAEIRWEISELSFHWCDHDDVIIALDDKHDELGKQLRTLIEQLKQYGWRWTGNDLEQI